jgi:hypothetical protein
MIHQESGRSWVMGWWWNTNKQSNQPLDLVPILTSSACCWLYTCLIKKLSHYFHPPSKEEKQSVPWSNSTRLYSGSRHSCSSLIHLILHNGYLLYCFPFLSLSLPLLRYGPFNQVAYNIVVSQNVGISRTELFVIDAWKSASQSHWSFNISIAKISSEILPHPLFSFFPNRSLIIPNDEAVLAMIRFHKLALGAALVAVLGLIPPSHIGNVGGE